MPCCAQAHLQEGPVEADGVHARERTEVGVQEGPVVKPRGRVSSGEDALCHRVERGVGREGADRAGGLGLFRAAGGGGGHGHGDHLTRLALRSKVTDAAFA